MMQRVRQGNCAPTAAAAQTSPNRPIPTNPRPSDAQDPSDKPADQHTEQHPGDQGGRRDHDGGQRGELRD